MIVMVKNFDINYLDIFITDDCDFNHLNIVITRNYQSNIDRSDFHSYST